MIKSITIAKVKTYTKTNEDGSLWESLIIDGMIIGMGIVSGLFVSKSKANVPIMEGATYDIEIQPTCMKAKLVAEVVRIGDLISKDEEVNF